MRLWVRALKKRHTRTLAHPEKERCKIVSECTNCRKKELAHKKNTRIESERVRDWEECKVERESCTRTTDINCYGGKKLKEEKKEGMDWKTSWLSHRCASFCTFVGCEVGLLAFFSTAFAFSLSLSCSITVSLPPIEKVRERAIERERECLSGLLSLCSLMVVLRQLAPHSQPKTKVDL